MFINPTQYKEACLVRYYISGIKSEKNLFLHQDFIDAGKRKS